MRQTCSGLPVLSYYDIYFYMVVRALVMRRAKNGENYTDGLRRNAWRWNVNASKAIQLSRLIGWQGNIMNDDGIHFWV